MRHSKTEGNNPRGDKARELLPRGREDAARIGQELAGIIREAVATADEALPVLLGKYEAKR